MPSDHSPSDVPATPAELGAAHDHASSASLGTPSAADLHDPGSPSTESRATEDAQEVLARLAGPDAVLRPDQAAAIDALVDGRSRVLVVQRTGWGKSAVYLVATRLLRDRGAGPTLLVSPLLALMRDQLAAAERGGVRAATINSSNLDEWAAVESALLGGEVDLLLVSPERLNHPRFRDEVLPRLTAGIGMLVVDEVHCISDWGHQFRPDYRRVRDVLDALPAGTPVLACTATANDRVVADVTEQLGQVDLALRGSLDRSSLRLSVVDQPDAAHRLAWLAAFVAGRDRPGIVYTLTVAETEVAARWLAERGIAAAAYSSKVEPEQREVVEAELKDGRLRAVVATSSLGMGYDHPELGWVVHLGAPDSPVAYYQAVGRAGRALAEAEVVLVPTPADERIWAHFDRTALPDPDQVEQLLSALPTDGTVSVPALEAVVPARRTRIEALLKVLDVDGAVERVRGGYRATGQPWTLDTDRVARVREARAVERQAMRDYRDGRVECRMAFLRSQLDDPDPAPCGRCDRCTGAGPAVAIAEEDVTAAWRLLRGQEHRFAPRKLWPPGLEQVRGRIPPGRQAAEGRALAFADDPGWGPVVEPFLAGAAAPGWDRTAAASPAPDPTDRTGEVVDGLVQVLARWDWDARPSWVTWVPSSSGDTAARLAHRLGELGRLPVVGSLRRIGDRRQDPTANSTHQAANALAGYGLLDVALPAGPVLLVDTVRRSGWSLTVAAWLLRGREGAGPVLPLVVHASP
jgi:ATP-dependent DNA helicase RecQ